MPTEAEPSGPGGTGCGWTVLSDKEDEEEDEVEAGGVLGLALELRAHAPAALRGESQARARARCAAAAQMVQVYGLRTTFHTLRTLQEKKTHLRQRVSWVAS